MRLKLHHYLEKTILILFPPYFHFSGYGTIVINYSFQSGIQGKEHPNPGQSYGGTSRVAYLPNTPEGCEVLQLLRRAFNSRLVFTVGTSATTGLHNQITWNDIHHKTTTHGGPYGYGILMYVCMSAVCYGYGILMYVCLLITLTCSPALLRLANYYCQSRYSVVRRLTKSLFARLTMVTEQGLNPRVKHLDGILSFRLMTSQPKSLSCLYLVGDSFKE